jgi:hypothetical protein
MILSQPPQCWDCRHVPPHLALNSFLKEKSKQECLTSQAPVPFHACHLQGASMAFQTKETWVFCVHMSFSAGPLPVNSTDVPKSSLTIKINITSGQPFVYIVDTATHRSLRRFNPTFLPNVCGPGLLMEPWALWFLLLEMTGYSSINSSHEVTCTAPLSRCLCTPHLGPLVWHWPEWETTVKTDGRRQWGAKAKGHLICGLRALARWS